MMHQIQRTQKQQQLQLQDYVAGSVKLLMYSSQFALN